VVRRALAGFALLAALAGCGTGEPTASPPPAVARPLTAVAASPSPRAWPQFGIDAARTNSTSAATQITAASAGNLRRHTIGLPGTVDSSPIFLPRVRVHGRVHDVIVVTTSYGRTLALDAVSGKRLWQFVPPGIRGWERSTQITNAAPAADPDHRSVYAAAPDGKVHKISLENGREVRAGAWPVAITRLPSREKITSALSVFDGYVLATTGGYVGDADPYQGHVVTIARSTGRIHAVFNSLCSDRRFLQRPSTCTKRGLGLASDSAIWGRAGAVVDRAKREVYVATGNGPFDGRRFWGDSMLVLSFPDLRLRRNWTPYNQQQLTDTDLDLGSVDPVLLPGGLVLQGGKDARMDVLSRARPNGRTTRPSPRLGGQKQTLKLPGGGQVLTSGAPAVSGDLVFVATDNGTAAYRVRGGRLRQVWANGAAGTSPVLAGGLLYVYDAGGRLNVYRPTTGARVASLAAGEGHWNSPIVVGGRVWLPEGSANDHATSGRLAVYSR